SNIVAADGKPLSDPADIVESLNSYFASCYVPSTSTLSTHCSPPGYEVTIPANETSPNLCTLSVTLSDVTSSLVRLRDSNFPGTDGIPSLILKAGGPDVPTLILNLFNISLITGTVPRRVTVLRCTKVLSYTRHPSSSMGASPIAGGSEPGLSFGKTTEDHGCGLPVAGLDLSRLSLLRKRPVQFTHAGLSPVYTHMFLLLFGNFPWLCIGLTLSVSVSSSNPDPAVMEMPIACPIAATLTTFTGLSGNRSISV
ncbi:hypothetical protein CLF_108062, partial [Clonorchis sinensis]